MMNSMGMGMGSLEANLALSILTGRLVTMAIRLVTRAPMLVCGSLVQISMKAYRERRRGDHDTESVQETEPRCRGATHWLRPVEPENVSTCPRSHLSTGCAIPRAGVLSSPVYIWQLAQSGPLAAGVAKY